MTRGTSTHRATTPARSANALRAYAAGGVTATIDLTCSPARVRERAQQTAYRSGIGLGVVASCIWAYDVVRVLGG
jgi:hypothetical protein